MGGQSMMLTMARQVILPVVLLTLLSGFGELSLLWLAFVLAEAVVIPVGILLWRKEAEKVLKDLAWPESRMADMEKNSSYKTKVRQELAG